MAEAAITASLKDHRAFGDPTQAEFKPAGCNGLRSSSPVMSKVLDLAARVAESDCNVLILGETGVGKERLARFIHQQSSRRRGPFLPVNCGALPESLFESELFGHARGAFTGATQDRLGLLEAAACGTLLLDEVGELPLSMQVKLLRVIQDREIRRVGDNHHRAVDVRILAATNRDLKRDVEENRFRLDLLYRLAVIELAIPPLRERREDIVNLADHVLARIAGRMHRTIVIYAPDALERLVSYGWPGNVRELENAVEHACLVARGATIELCDLPEFVRHETLAGPTLVVKPLRELERDYIYAVLRRNGCNKTVTAQQLGISPATLFRKLRRYNEPRASTRRA